MEPVLDKFKNILNVHVKKEYYNNYCIFKSNYIKELSNIEDDKILQILKCNYLMYGIITKDMIENKTNNVYNYFNENSDENSDENFLYKNPQIINFADKIIDPLKLFNKVNKVIDNTNKIITLVNEYYEVIKDFDVQILRLLTSLKTKNLPVYLENFIVFNNIRIFINSLFFEYYQDVDYINNRLLQIKYDYFILETDIFKLNQNALILLNNYKDSKIFVLKLEDKLVNFKVVDGEIDINQIIELIEEKIDKLNNLDS